MKYKDSIALNKINQIHVKKVNTSETNIINSRNQRSVRNKTDKTTNPDEKDLYELYVSEFKNNLCKFYYLSVNNFFIKKQVSKSEEPDYDLDKDETKKLLFTHDFETVQWLKEKINSAIKYYKELRNVME